MALNLECQQRKQGLRHQIAERLASIDMVAFKEKNAALCRHLSAMALPGDCHTVATYAAMAREADPALFVADCHNRDWRVLMPRYDLNTGFYRMACVSQKENLLPGRFDILEPGVDAPEADNQLLASPQVLWLVPGISFDAQGGRLGRGGGFYDRLLARVSGPNIGLAFHCQLVDTVPREIHDVLMEWIVTEKGVVYCRKTVE